MEKKPLADLLRPATLEEVIGQDHLTGASGFITKIIDSNKPLSILLWGPPGCGKTTIAGLYAKAFDLPFRSMSAIFSGVADLRKVIQESQSMPLLHQGIVLFVDEIHRFNKAQQDAFLPFIEDGTIILVGATAENPSFYLNNALLSRLRVLKLNALNEENLEKVIRRYESVYQPLPISSEARTLLVESAHGDARYLLNLIENIRNLKSTTQLTVEEVSSLLQKRAPLFDKGGDGHYNLISALHKSVRGSDPNAALYWFCRILEGGEDPRFLARRIIRMATEDIGLADPQALQLAIAAKDAYEMLGSPEGELALAEAVIYLALAPKSNAVYTAYGIAKEKASQTNHLNPPSIILNAPTKLMKEMGYGKGYLYDHDQPDAFSGQNYFPKEMTREEYYKPVERGFEREMIKRIKYFKRLYTEKE